MPPLRHLLSILLLVISGPTCSYAQGGMTGEIDYPGLGITFTVPEGWQAHEGEGVVMIGSDSIPGLIIMSILEVADLEEMKLVMGMGMAENGMEFFPEGPVTELPPDAAHIRYSGRIEERPARAIGLGILDPHGNAVSILALAFEDVWSDALETTAVALKESLRFRPIEYSGPSMELWKKHLTNTRLTRLEGHSSPAPTEGGTGGGTESRQRIDLCGNGRYRMTTSGTVAVGSENASGLSSGSNVHEGAWDVAGGTGGRPILRLDHDDGQRSEFQLDEQEGRVYLNGLRWFRTWNGEHAPDCE